MSAIGNLFIISAPSGAGKTSLVKALLQRDPHICVSVSHTTRAKRSGEQHGIDYNFIDQAAFAELVNNQQMLEHATVFGNAYGTSRTWVEQAIAQGKDVILEIDWQGRDQVLQLLPKAVAITILPPSKAALQKRLADRGTDSDATIAQRMAEAENEISHYAGSHYLLINDDFTQALTELAAIFVSERLQTKRQSIKHQQLLADLLSNDG
ncbi:MAG: guanylate kinase [Gammaproteobacteria bacterium]|jgi:guanylate kinase|nr:guanylate kinase [Gammaproteobacteria bacterium]